MDLTLSGETLFWAVVALAAIGAVLVFGRILSRRSSSGERAGNAGPAAGQPSAAIRARPLPVSEDRIWKNAFTASRYQALPREHSLSGRTPDLTEGINEIAARYSLRRLLLVTADGLMVGSSDGADPERTAASLAEAFRQGNVPEDPGILMFPLEHRGSGLVCIACTGADHPPLRPAGIEQDIRSLLNHAL